jgi:hypothetical protein
MSATAAYDAIEAMNEEVPDGATVIAGDEATAKVLEGRELIDEETRALADRCAKAVLDHPKAAAMLAFGKTEEPITWTDRETGVPCKARLDLGKPGFVLDVKSSRQPTLRGICADFARPRNGGRGSRPNRSNFRSRTGPPGRSMKSARTGSPKNRRRRTRCQTHTLRSWRSTRPRAPSSTT